MAQRMVERPAIKARMFLDIQRSTGETASSAELVRRFVHRFQSNEWPTGSPTPQVFYDPRALLTDRVKRAALHAKRVVADGQEVLCRRQTLPRPRRSEISKSACCSTPPRLQTGLRTFLMLCALEGNSCGRCEELAQRDSPGTSVNLFGSLPGIARYLVGPGRSLFTPIGLAGIRRWPRVQQGAEPHVTGLSTILLR